MPQVAQRLQALGVVARQQTLDPAPGKGHRGRDLGDVVPFGEKPDCLNVPRRGCIRARVIALLQRRNTQMIGHMRHGAPPRLMAPQSIGSTDLQESHPTPSPGNRMRHLRRQPWRDPSLLLVDEFWDPPRQSEALVVAPVAPNKIAVAPARDGRAQIQSAGERQYSSVPTIHARHRSFPPILAASDRKRARFPGGYQEDKDWSELRNDPSRQKWLQFKTKYPETRFEKEMNDLISRMIKGEKALKTLEEKKDIDLAIEIKTGYKDIPYIMKEADRFINDLAANPIDENEIKSATYNDVSFGKDFPNASDSAGSAIEKETATKSIIDIGSFSTRYNNTART